MRTTKIRSRLSLLFIALAAMIALPAVAALADTLTVSNTLITNTDTSKAAGATGTVNVWLEPTNGDPTGDPNGCNAGTGDNAATVTLSSNNAAVTFPNGNTATLTDCSTTGSVGFKVADDAEAGSAIISATVTGGKTKQTNLYNTNDTMTVTITAAAKKNTTTTSVSGSATYGGTATLTATLKEGTNNLAGKPVTFTLDGASVGQGTTDSSGVATKSGVSLPAEMTNAGSYTNAVSANFAGDGTHNGSTGSGALTVSKAQATLSLSNLNPTYNGQTKPVTVTTDPAGLSGVSVTYDGSATAPTNAGSYSVVASLDNPNYTATNATGTLVINKANQSITFGTLANKTFGDAPFQLDASASSGLSVSYTASEASDCTVSGNTVTITGAGSCEITASQAGNTNYNAATDVTRTFSIAKAPATLSLSGLTGQTYDGNPKSVTVTTSPANLSGVSVTYDGQTTAPTNAGSYSVVASLDNRNYQASDATGTLVINKANQSITFGTLTDKIVGANFTVSATGGGSGNAVTFAASGPCTVSGNSVSVTGAGTCTITASQAGNANYNAATDVARTFKASYSFAGFFQPIDGDLVNAGKTGRTYPVKWQLRELDANGQSQLISDAKGTELASKMVAKSRAASSACTGVGSDALEQEVTTSSTSVKYDTAADQFVYNYKAPSTQGCVVLDIFYSDPSTGGLLMKGVTFNFTK